MTTPSDLICVGAIAGAFGVHGEVRLKSFTAEAEAIADYAPLTTEDGGTSFDLVLTRSIKNGLAARLSGVTTKEEADALKGTQLYAPRDRLPELEEDEFYYTDLVGLAAVTVEGEPCGQVIAVQDYGAGPLLEVRPEDGGATELIPFTAEAVPEVDLTGGRVVIDPPPEDADEEE